MRANMRARVRACRYTLLRHKSALLHLGSARRRGTDARGTSYSCSVRSKGHCCLAHRAVPGSVLCAPHALLAGVGRAKVRAAQHGLRRAVAARWARRLDGCATASACGWRARVALRRRGAGRAHPRLQRAHFSAAASGCCAGCVWAQQPACTLTALLWDPSSRRCRRQGHGRMQRRRVE